LYDQENRCNLSLLSELRIKAVSPQTKAKFTETGQLSVDFEMITCRRAGVGLIRNIIVALQDTKKKYQAIAKSSGQ